MMGVYGSGKVCPYDNQECDPETEGMNLEPEIEEQMAENRDYDQLAYYWQKWRDATGRVYRLVRIKTGIEYVTFTFRKR